jgi:molybdopterin molybdotransferase
MITLDEAQKRIDGAVNELPMALVPLIKAVGCCLGEDIISPINVPEFESSAVDGVAIRVSDLKGSGPWTLPIQTTIKTGDFFQGPLLPMYAARIMTGAPIIKGADIIIPVENATIDGDQIIIKNHPGSNNNILPIADDINSGQHLFSKGDVLGSVEIGVLASIGLSEVEVISNPKIALLTTGSEIVEPGNKLKPGQIYNTNSVLLQTLMKTRCHQIDTIKNISYDDIDVLSRAIRGCFDSCELVVSSGGISRGEQDFIPQAIKKLGGKLLFHEVAIRPGNPIIVARVEPRWFVGLSGNPVGAIIGYHLFVKRIISLMLGCSYRPQDSQVLLGSDLEIKSNRCCFVGARLEKSEDKTIAYPVPRQNSKWLSSIIGIDGFIRINTKAKNFKKGNMVNFAKL